MKKRLLYFTLVFLLAAGFCEAQEEEQATVPPQKLWEDHVDAAWQWASKSKDVRLTKSHQRRPTFHKNLSVVYKEKKPTRLRYCFYMWVLPKEYDPATASFYPFGEDDIVVEYDLVKKGWRLVWPNSLWIKYSNLAGARAYNWLSRSHYGGTPWFDINESLVYDNGNFVALRYHMAFVFQKTKNTFELLKQLEKERRPNLIIEYNIKKEEWIRVYPKHENAKPVKEQAAQPSAPADVDKPRR